MSRFSSRLSARRSLRTLLTLSGLLAIGLAAGGGAQALGTPSGVAARTAGAPVNTKQPDPSGTAKEGSVVTVSNGTWTGTQPITYSYQWQRCNPKSGRCTNVQQPTGASYQIVAADVGFTLRAVVTASNSAGRSSARSNLTPVVVARGQPPVALTLPAIAGTPAIGQTLIASSGTWKGASGVFSYQWLRCSASGGGCAGISGAATQSYVVSSADAGSTLSVRVRASNTVGATVSVATPVKVTTPGGGGGGGGGGANSVPVTSLVAHPDHLLISGVQFFPSPFHTRGGVITARFRVTLEGTSKGVSGALVAVVGIPYSWVLASPETPTGSDGWVTFQIRTTSRMQFTRGGALVMQVRARAPGTSAAVILGGISTRRLVQVSLGAAG
jgi:hypothetical protein